MIKNNKGCANNPFTSKRDDSTTQAGKSLSLLLTGKKLHRYICRNELGSESLHSIISYLRNSKNIPIQSAGVCRLDFIGKRKHVKLYWIDAADIARITDRKD